MKNIALAVSLIIAVVFGITSLMLFNTGKKLSNQASDSSKTITALASSLSQKDATISELESKMAQLVQAMNNSAAKIESQKTQLADQKTRLDAFEMSASQKQDRAKLASLQPITKDGDKVIFPKLLSSGDVTLMLNAQYRSRIGRKLTFKNSDGFGVYDVDNIHPGALIQLGVDPAVAKSEQASIDKGNQMAAILTARAAQDKAKRDGQFIALQTEQNQKQAVIDEQNRQQAVLENQRQQVLDHDKTVADAAMREANAALIRAVNPL